MVTRIVGATPAGGTYSIAVGFDSAGIEIDDLNAAAFVVITEYNEQDEVLLRTTAGIIVDSIEDRDALFAALEGDDSIDPDSTDMGKDTWDVRRPSDQKPVDNMADFIAVMQWNVETPEMRRNFIANFTILPAWNAAPQSLKDEVNQYLGS